MRNSTIAAIIGVTFITAAFFVWWSFTHEPKGYQMVFADSTANEHYWVPPDINTLPDNDSGKLIRYGRDLIVNTAKYFGSKGSVIANHTNGMNCQNCHQEAGTKIWGNNYSAVYATYPKYRARNGTVDNIYKRVNDCFERSLNGKALDNGSKEMQAIKSYIEWLGHDVEKGTKPKGSGIYEVAFMNYAAAPEKGKVVYINKCQSCHQQDGQGMLAADGIAYTYPPLWGQRSYNIGAGLYRLSRLAGYVKYNMPFGTDFTKPQLTDEEAWNVAAYINSQQRPDLNLSKDWPKIIEKPVDYPYGPYIDSFSESQHKYGPYPPIVAYLKSFKNN
ncbi:MAG: c-type cytochrome [Bacteroidetes bacterium]|nr:c-type cytochrome [Bacteroidota bacterium]